MQKPCISEHTWDLINSRLTMKNDINTAKTWAAKAVMRNEYTRLNKLIKKGASKDKRERQQISSDAQGIADTRLPTIKSLMYADGVPTTSKEKVNSLKRIKFLDPTTCSKNWRRFTILYMVNKILVHIINKGISDYILPRLSNELAGFRTHWSYVDQVNIMRIIVEQSVKWQTANVEEFLVN